MAVKFYGENTGTSGNKYDIWLEVSENSHNISENTSNVTAKLKLKRNDGYANSAYNLNESDNSASIFFAGKVKKSINLSIDTRNSVTLTLVTYTGDVAHNPDGSLNLSVSASFKMAGTSLEGGSVSGVFKCVNIPRASSFSLNKTSFKPDDSVQVSIQSHSESFMHKVIWEIGEYKKTVSLAKGVVSHNLTVPYEWANAVTNSKKGVVTVTLNTYKSSTLIGKSVKTATLNIPSTNEFLPEFNIDLKNTGNSVTGQWNVFVENKSKLQVSLTGVVLKYGAKNYTAYAEFLSSRKTSLPCEFDINKSGELNVLVRVTDSRGIFSEKIEKITVYDYVLPNVTIKSLLRCNSSGVPDNAGTSALLDFEIQKSNVNSLNESKIRLRYKKEVDSAFSDYITITASPIILNNNFSASSSYIFELSVSDSLTSTPFCVTRNLLSSVIPFNIKKGGDGAAFGCYSEKSNELTVGYNLNVKGTLVGEDLSEQITFNSPFSKNFIKIKKYMSLGYTFINGVIVVNGSVSANTLTSVFRLLQNAPIYKTAVSVIDESSGGSTVINGFIDTTGELKIKSNVSLSQNNKLYISAFY